MRDYPALLVQYAAGVAAVTAKRFHNVAAVLQRPEQSDPYTDKRAAAVARLNVWQVFQSNDRHVAAMAGETRAHLPNDYVFQVVEAALEGISVDSAQYEESFDLFEFLLTLTHADRVDGSWLPIGRFHRTYGGYGNRRWTESTIASFLKAEEDRGDRGLLISAGFFDGKYARFHDMHQSVIEHLTQLHAVFG